MDLAVAVGFGDFLDLSQHIGGEMPPGTRTREEVTPRCLVTR